MKDLDMLLLQRLKELKPHGLMMFITPGLYKNTEKYNIGHFVFAEYHHTIKQFLIDNDLYTEQDQISA